MHWHSAEFSDTVLGRVCWNKSLNMSSILLFGLVGSIASVSSRIFENGVFRDCRVCRWFRVNKAFSNSYLLVKMILVSSDVVLLMTSISVSGVFVLLLSMSL